MTLTRREDTELAPGVNHDNLVAYVEGLVAESDTRRRGYVIQAEKNLNHYLYGKDAEWTEKDGVPRAVVNRIQGAVLSILSMMTAKPIIGRFKPVESNEPSKYYLTQHGLEKFNAAYGRGQMMVDGQGWDALQALTEVPTLMGEQLEGMTKPWMDPTTGKMEPPLLDPMKDLIILNDQTTANLLQTGVDLMKERCNADYFIWENILNNQVIGWASMIFQWNCDLHQPEVFNLHPKNCQLDPTATAVERMHYFVYDEVISADQAKAQIPGAAEYIDSVKMKGGFDRSPNFNLASVLEETTFARFMVRVRRCWLRWQPYELSPEEAQERSLIEPATVVKTADGQQYEGTMHEHEGLMYGGEVHDEASPELTQESVYSRTDDETIVTGPDDERWPRRFGVRQLIIIGQKIVQDMECPYRLDGESEMPILWNRSVPILFEPYGQGDPEKLMSLQDLVNRTADAMMRHILHNTSNEKVLPASARADIGETEDLNLNAGRTWWIKDQTLVAMRNKLMGYLEAPPMPSWVPQMYAQMVQGLDDTAGHSAVVQGRSEFSGQSGAAIKALQEAALGPVTVKAKQIEFMVQRLTKFIAQAMIDFLPNREWARIFSGLPPEIAAVFRTRAMSMKYNVEVDVAFGSDTVRETKKYETREMFAQGLLSRRTAQESLGIREPEREGQRIDQERMGGVAPDAAGGGQQPPKPIQKDQAGASPVGRIPAVA